MLLGKTIIIKYFHKIKESENVFNSVIRHSVSDKLTKINTFLEVESI